MSAANRRLSDRQIKDIVSAKNGALERLIGELRKTRKFPKGTNFEVLVSQVRVACESYSPDSGLSRTERHGHLNKLYQAIKSALNYKDGDAQKLGVLYGEVADLFASLSSLDLREISLRVERLNTRKRSAWQRSQDAESAWLQYQIDNGLPASREGSGAEPVYIVLPTAEDLRSADKREPACEALLSLIQFGGEFVEYSKASAGGGSRSWRSFEPHLLVPETAKAAKRRLIEGTSSEDVEELIGWKKRPRWAPEKALVGGLRLAWMEATGKSASSTAKRYEKTSSGKFDFCLGPFATLVERLLDLCDVKGISVVKLLNQMKLDRETEAEREKRRDMGRNRSVRSPSK
jgi:hypothetical protein